MSETKPLTQQWKEILDADTTSTERAIGYGDCIRMVEQFAATHLAEQTEPSAHDWKVANTAFSSDAEKASLLAKLLMLKGNETAQRIRALLCGNSSPIALEAQPSVAAQGTDELRDYAILAGTAARHEILTIANNEGLAAAWRAFENDKGRDALASHDAALKASVREEALKEFKEALNQAVKQRGELAGWLYIDEWLPGGIFHKETLAALAHPEKASQPVNELETRGTMECPICGVAAMHPHSRQEIVSWLKAQGTRFGVDVVDAQIPFGVRVEEIAKSIGERIVLHFFGNRPQLSDQQVIMARNQMKECQPLIAKILNDCHILAIAQPQTEGKQP